MLETDGAAELAGDSARFSWVGAASSSLCAFPLKKLKSSPSAERGWGASAKIVESAGLPLEGLTAMVLREFFLIAVLGRTSEPC